LRTKAVVPVLLGASIPRNDRSEEEYKRYCRTMLLLFTSWCSFTELKGEHTTWHEAFEAYEFSPELQSIINNMNVENECKDARDMHAAKVHEKCARPYMFGSAANNGDAENEDVSVFDEAIFADASL
ncbi:uncharacterized protein F5147DRAFT_537571, partial [Suillus discolor]